MTKVDGQVWFQEGDRWVYDYSGGWGLHGYEEIWVEGDTILNGQSCKVLKSQRTTVRIWPDPNNDTLTSVGPSYFVYEQSDSVFLYEPNTEESQPLYNFSAAYNLDVVMTIEGCPNNSSIEQTLSFLLFDTTNVQVSNQNRRVQLLLNLDVDNTGLEEHFITVIEGIGMVNIPSNPDGDLLIGENFGHVIFPFAYPCPDGENRTFCSFTSNGETYNPENQDCYALPVPVAVDNLSITPVTYDLYPNPANTHFSVQNLFKLPIKKVTIFNANGNVEKMISQPPKEIAISDLAKGIYIVEVAIGDGLVYKKLVKQ